MEDIKSLRKKQFIWVNTVLILAYAIFLYFIFIQNIYVNNINFFVGLFLIVNSIFTFYRMDRKIHLFEWMRRVQEYEREKLGGEWRKSQKVQAISMLVLGMVLLLNFFTSLPYQPPAQMVDNSHMYPFLIILVLFFMVVVNIGLYTNMKKIDKKSTEELAGFTKRETIKGLVIGVIVGLAIFFVSIIVIGSRIA